MNTQYIPVEGSAYSTIRVDRVGTDELITVYNVSLSHLDDLIAKLQALKPKAVEPVQITVPFPATAKLIHLPEDDEPEEMTAVLGMNPDPTGWVVQRVELTTPTMPQPKRGAGILNVVGVPNKSFKRGGIVTPAYKDTKYNADIVKNESIRIYGLGDHTSSYDVKTNTYTSSVPAFDLTFKVGDSAVHGSFNLVYTGTITAIGEKTVKIEQYGKTHQLDLHTFIMRNWDYDAAKIFKRNSEWSD